MHFARGHVLTALVGLALGLIGAAALAQVLTALLFGVEAHDVATFVTVGAIIVVISAIACIPSLFRLQRVNPADCLRSL
jgi:ABC-type antimicrobial peptide transport system permease subunit